MPKYRGKPVVIEAFRWYHNDRPLYETHVHDYRVSFGGTCRICGRLLAEHGWIPTPEGGLLVCPGDWVITDADGSHHPCKPDLFERVYEPVEEEPEVSSDPDPG